MRKPSYSIENLKAIAESRGGLLVSRTFTFAKDKLEWQCVEGHTWQAVPYSVVKMGTWCPSCAGNLSASLSQMHHLASLKNGKCNSKKYINSQSHLEWECEYGHKWLATPAKVKFGKWCRKCASTRNGLKKRLSIDTMKELALSRNGLCLSETYSQSTEHLLWQCSVGHEWFAAAAPVVAGSWCPHCVGKAKMTLQDAVNAAAKFGGLCLSEKYEVGKKQLWQCAEGHQWNTKLHYVRGGSWCPECSEGLGERIARRFMEEIFQAPFPKSNFKWLKSIKGGAMHLDGYSKHLSIAFEHQGAQHYKHISFFSSNEDFSQLQARDIHKRKLCELQTPPIVILAIPEIPNMLPVEKVKDFIISEASKYGIHIPPSSLERTIALDGVYSSGALEAMVELKELATQKGGRCVSSSYLGSVVKLEWECANDHSWKMAPSQIKIGQWCPKCAKKSLSEQFRDSIEKYKRLAQTRGGECLSENYTNGKIPLTWKCKSGHVWDARPSNVQTGTWCVICAGRAKPTIAIIQEVAKERGGKCLDDQYLNAKTDMKWKCSEGHEWKASWNSISSRKSWCPVCGIAKRVKSRRCPKLKDSNSTGI